MYKLRCPNCGNTAKFIVEQRHDEARAICDFCNRYWAPRCLQPKKKPKKGR